MAIRKTLIVGMSFVYFSALCAPTQVAAQDALIGGLAGGLVGGIIAGSMAR